MLTIKIEATGFSNKAETDLSVEVKVQNIDTDAFATKLGSVIYSVEEMGFDFNTDSVYHKAIETYNNTVLGNRFSTIFNDYGIKISVRNA